MEFKEVIESVKEPEKLIDHRVVDELIFWVSAWKDDKEEELLILDQQVAVKKLALIEVHKSVAKAEAYLATDPLYLKQQEVEFRIKQLASFRANLKRRYEILTNKFR